MMTVFVVYIVAFCQKRYRIQAEAALKNYHNLKQIRERLFETLKPIGLRELRPTVG